jgi:hypothetical protein
VRSADGSCLAASHQPEAQRPEKPVLMSVLKECMHVSMSMFCRSVEWRNVCFMLDSHGSGWLSFPCGHRFPIDSCGWILRVDGWLPIFNALSALRKRLEIIGSLRGKSNQLSHATNLFSLLSIKASLLHISPIKQITHRPHAQRPITLPSPITTTSIIAFGRC